MKKFTKLMLSTASILMLGACEKSYSEKLSSNSNVVNIEEEAKGPIKSTKRELQSVVKLHEISFHDSKFSIEKRHTELTKTLQHCGITQSQITFS